MATHELKPVPLMNYTQIRAGLTDADIAVIQSVYRHRKVINPIDFKSHAEFISSRGELQSAKKLKQERLIEVLKFPGKLVVIKITPWGKKFYSEHLKHQRRKDIH